MFNKTTLLAYLVVFQLVHQRYKTHITMMIASPGEQTIVSPMQMTFVTVLLLTTLIAVALLMRGRHFTFSHDLYLSLDDTPLVHNHVNNVTTPRFFPMPTPLRRHR